MRKIVFLLTLCSTAFLEQFVSAAEPLNVLLITADDLGLQLGCYGETAIQTPHLDALAERSTVFDVAYVTQASCSPSRSSMFTGLYPHTNGQYGLLNAGVGFELHPEYRSQTIPAYLKRAGYRTGIIGKLHVGPEDSFPFDERFRVDGRDVKGFAETVASFMQPGSPFFLMVNYTDPHAYRANRQARTWSFPDQWKGLPKDPVAVGDVPPFPFQQIDSSTQMKRVTGYYNTVERLDDGIGLLLEKLQASGQADRTLIIFVGDHGPPFTRGKTTCYEAGLRVPFIVSWPEVSRPMHSSAMVTTADILPTILDATGVQTDQQFQGRSLRPAVTSEQPDDWREFLAAEFHYHGSQPFFPRRAIRSDRFKLIHNLLAGEKQAATGIDGDTAFAQSQAPKYARTPIQQAFNRLQNPPEYELYDLQADPWEFKNLSEDEDYAEQLSQLKTALSDWREKTSDPLLTEEGWKAVSAYEK